MDRAVRARPHAKTRDHACGRATRFARRTRCQRARRSVFARGVGEKARRGSSARAAEFDLVLAARVRRRRAVVDAAPRARWSARTIDVISHNCPRHRRAFVRDPGRERRRGRVRSRARRRIQPEPGHGRSALFRRTDRLARALTRRAHDRHGVAPNETTRGGSTTVRWTRARAARDAVRARRDRGTDGIGTDERSRVAHRASRARVEKSCSARNLYSGFSDSGTCGTWGRTCRTGNGSSSCW